MGISQPRDLEPVIGLDTSWKMRAFCRGVDTALFFNPKEAKRIKREFCAHCPVKRECLESALLRDEYGVWGETNTTEREKQYSQTFRNSMREDYL